MEIDLLSAFFIGILSAGHCLGMCGGVTSMLTSAIPENNPAIDKRLQHNLLSNTPLKKNYSKLALVVSYNIGRILSYAFLGAIVGLTGSIAAKNIGLPLAGLRVIAGIFLVLLGLYLGQWLMILGKIEVIGKKLWQFVSPLSKNFIPVNSPIKALALGGIWGWLPCGLVYSTLTWSLASGEPLTGALIMLCFGLGTLPALLTMSFGILSLKSILKNRAIRKTMAISIILYGFYSIFVACKLMF
ncbi:MAG: sulfite exporter TauE/SafE family protein [Colwellia sp.]|nr:sulfite exporter TauE/SafE family protein [Colwellia sp.]